MKKSNKVKKLTRKQILDLIVEGKRYSMQPMTTTEKIIVAIAWIGLATFVLLAVVSGVK